MALLEAIGKPIDDAAIPIVAAQLGVAAGGLDIEDALGDTQHGHIEGATTEVEHQHPLNGAAVEAIGQGGSGGFIDDPLHGQARQPTGVAGGLALGIVEIGGNGDHRRLHRLPQIGGRVIAKLAQDAGQQLLWGIFALSGRADDPHVALGVGTHGVWHREAALVQLIPLAPHKALQI